MGEREEEGVEEMLKREKGRGRNRNRGRRGMEETRRELVGAGGGGKEARRGRMVRGRGRVKERKGMVVGIKRRREQRAGEKNEPVTANENKKEGHGRSK